jgi:hypothetical protein
MSGENRDTGVAWSFHDATKYVWLGDEPGGRWFGMGTPPELEAPIWEEDWSLEPFLSSPRGTRLVNAPSKRGGRFSTKARACAVQKGRLNRRSHWLNGTQCGRRPEWPVISATASLMKG